MDLAKSLMRSEAVAASAAGAGVMAVDGGDAGLAVQAQQADGQPAPSHAGGSPQHDGAEASAPIWGRGRERRAARSGETPDANSFWGRTWVRAAYGDAVRLERRNSWYRWLSLVLALNVETSTRSA